MAQRASRPRRPGNPRRHLCRSWGMDLLWVCWCGWLGVGVVVWRCRHGGVGMHGPEGVAEERRAPGVKGGANLGANSLKTEGVHGGADGGVVACSISSNRAASCMCRPDVSTMMISYPSSRNTWSHPPQRSGGSVAGVRFVSGGCCSGVAVWCCAEA